MKKSIILLFIFSASLSAADWSSHGFSLLSSQKDSSDVTTDTIQDKNKNEVTVTYTGDLTENYIRNIEKFNNDFRSWANMKVQSIKFSIANDEIQIFVSPLSYTHNDINLMDYLSSGILFTYKVNLMYNFRILVEKLFVPIKGIYVDEKSFSDKIASAIKDPVTFINARDPEYLLEKLDKLTVDVVRLRNAELAKENGNHLVDKAVIDLVLDIKSKNPAFTYKEINEKISKEKLAKTNSDIVRNILRFYLNEY
jgi:hypothetical protein